MRVRGPESAGGGGSERRRLTLRPFELGFLLEVPELEIRARIESGELFDVSCDRWVRVDVEQAAELVEREVERGAASPLAAFLLDELAAGRIEVARGDPSAPAATSLVSALLGRRMAPVGPGGVP